MRDACGWRLSLSTVLQHAPHYTWVEGSDTKAHGRAWHAPPPIRYPSERKAPAGSGQCPCGAGQRWLCAEIGVRLQGGIGKTTGHGFGYAILALWFLLCVALAGPHREKPHS